MFFLENEWASRGEQFMQIVKWGILEEFNGSHYTRRGYTHIFVVTSFGVYLIEVLRKFDSSTT